MESPSPDVAGIAERLVAAKVRESRLVRGGGNNRIYRVETEAGPIALKGYTVVDGDPRDRLGTEWAALALVSRHLPGRVPRPLARDAAAGWAAYEWIDGDKIGSPAPAEIDAATDFLRALLPLRTLTDAGKLPLASEAILSLDALLAQLDWRVQRLVSVADLDTDARAFLGEQVRPAIARMGHARGAGVAELPAERRVLSPSDFGFHNALRRPGGELVFLDFEYFGWDDPAKLASDIHWHPGMALGATDRQRFAAGLADIFGADRDYARRLDVYRPLIGLRWCLILLNEFLPQGLARRRHAGQAEDIEAARARQLDKARALYSEVVQGL
ncbi:MAG: aminoglycoside phosphotransferase family protein [Alphaproteobacteria bacterium]|nr:aminoglycoside phosphotransferase family protein [Alphaproteobacteria bacterium]